MKPMNVFYIHTHDSGNIISPYGYKVPSPNLEKFGEGSTLFRNAFATAPTCSPSRGSLLTGQYPSTHGMIGLCNRNFQLANKDHHLAKYMSSLNYDTALCGIQHEAGHYNDSKLVYKDIGYMYDLSSENELKDMTDKREWDNENVSSAIKWLEEREKNNPLFLSLGFFGTHRQFPKADKDYRSTPPMGLAQNEVVSEDFNDYCASLENVDNNFKIFIDALDRLGYKDNSIIIFTSDHGIGFPFGKSTLYDGGTKVALIISKPGNKTAGQISNRLVSQVDIFPTLCDLLDIEKPQWLQGSSFANEFINKDNEPGGPIFSEMTFHTSYEPARAIRNDRFKLIKYYDQSYPNQNLSNINESVTKYEYIDKGLQERNKSMIQLYDLFFDPNEKNNLANDPNYQGTLKELDSQLEAWRVSVGDPILNDNFTWENNWVVNKKESIIPSSKEPSDYVVGHGKEFSKK